MREIKRIGDMTPSIDEERRIYEMDLKDDYRKESKRLFARNVKIAFVLAAAITMVWVLWG